ncbi:MAG: DUF4105 domain-containing protein [Paludibacteraceae bacterium]|nr:DUF4105 domain-containing protein [Paludibacteraceae bacterium]
MSTLFRTYCLWIVTLFSLCLFGQESVPQEAETLSVAERNALQGFNDTIDRLADDFVEAYVSIAEPGDYLYTTLGHAAYHMKCPKFGLDYYFTMEGESSKNALLRFLAGDLKMGLLALSPEEYLSFYREENRGVREWKINLSPERKQHLWAVLDSLVVQWNGLPYDYYHRCCAITIVNIMNELVGRENIHYATPWPEKFKHTPREFIYYALKGHDEWTQFFICLLAGNEVDKNIPNERKFIVPMDVVEAWQKATIDGQVILSEDYVEVLPSGVRKPNTWWTPLHIGFILLIVAFLSLCTIWTHNEWIKRAGVVIDYTILGIITSIGIGMTYLLFFSNLCCTDWNWLFIAFNPLPFIFWKWCKYWALPYALLMLVWVLAMILSPHLLALWSHQVLTLSFIVVLIKQYWRTKA